MTAGHRQRDSAPRVYKVGPYEGKVHAALRTHSFLSLQSDGCGTSPEGRTRSLSQSVVWLLGGWPGE